MPDYWNEPRMSSGDRREYVRGSGTDRSVRCLARYETILIEFAEFNPPGSWAAWRYVQDERGIRGKREFLA